MWSLNVFMVLVLFVVMNIMVGGFVRVSSVWVSLVLVSFGMWMLRNVICMVCLDSSCSVFVLEDVVRILLMCVFVCSRCMSLFSVGCLLFVMSMLIM